MYIYTCTYMWHFASIGCWKVFVFQLPSLSLFTITKTTAFNFVLFHILPPLFMCIPVLICISNIGGKFREVEKANCRWVMKTLEIFKSLVWKKKLFNVRRCKIFEASNTNNYNHKKLMEVVVDNNFQGHMC